MKEEFKSVCNKLIEENEVALKQAREEVKITSKKTTGPAVNITISGVIALIGFLIFEETQHIIGLIIGLIAVITCFISIKKVQKNKENEKDYYNEIYQNKIIKPLMKLFYDEPYFYMPKVGIVREIFEEIEFRNFTIYQSTHLINGTINQHYNFKMANVVALNRIHNFFLTNGKPHYDVIFDGLLVEIELPKSFNHYLYLKDKKNILFKNLSDISKEFKLKKYKFRKDDFEKEFDVYTSDEDFTERILSDDIIQNLLAYRNVANSSKTCEISIKNNFVYLMFPNTHVPGTDVVLYENKELMYQELWKQFERFHFVFELANTIINKSI